MPRIERSRAQEHSDAGRVRAVSSQTGGAFMTRMILATVAAAALCVPAFAQSQKTDNTQQTNPPAAQAQNLAGAKELAASRMNPIQVREIQQALDKEGFKAVHVDGKWGPQTMAALKDFQKSKNINSTGDVDSMTITALGLSTSDFGMGGNVGTTGQAPSGSSSKGSRTSNPPNNGGTQGGSH
jgi:peptidoglycan hydrolase-like protein with peptidoglycan-binding domain